jgi:hypothetical protein
VQYEYDLTQSLDEAPFARMSKPIKKTMVGSPEVEQQKAARNTKPHRTISDIQNETQTVSYWAGQRIEGPIRRFEIKDDYTTKLQN